MQAPWLFWVCLGVGTLPALSLPTVWRGGGGADLSVLASFLVPCCHMLLLWGCFEGAGQGWMWL